MQLGDQFCQMAVTCMDHLDEVVYYHLNGLHGLPSVICLSVHIDLYGPYMVKHFYLVVVGFHLQHQFYYYGPL